MKINAMLKYKIIKFFKLKSFFSNFLMNLLFLCHENDLLLPPFLGAITQRRLHTVLTMEDFINLTLTKNQNSKSH
jgi:hypothetical protein